jgi:hypothetical protein
MIAEKLTMKSQPRRLFSILAAMILCILPLSASAQTVDNTSTNSILVSLESLTTSLAKQIALLLLRHSQTSLTAAAAASITGTGTGSCGTLATNATLTPGQSIVSCGGGYTLLFQTDGNIVLYPAAKLGQTGSYWNTKTNGIQSSSFVMQSDGNLVLYGPPNSSNALWSSRLQPGGTYGSPGHLVVGDNAVLTVYANSNGSVLWTSTPGATATISPSTTTSTSANTSSIQTGQSAPLATVSISADNSSITVGQSTTIRASYAAGSGDTLVDTDIDENGPDTNNTGVNKSYSGSQWGTPVQQSLTYTFTPTKPGSYGFYTFVLTKDYPSWTTVPSSWTPVTVTAAPAVTASNGPLTGTFTGLLSGASVPTLTGWASNPNSSTGVDVDVYMDGPASAANNYANGVARIPANINGDSFQWPIPTAYQGTTHTFYLYAVTADGSNGTSLAGSPQTINVPAVLVPTVSLTQSLTTTTETNGVGNPFTLSWTSANATACTVQQQTPSGLIVNPWATGVSGTYTPRPGGIGTDHYWIDCNGAGGTVHQDIYHFVTTAQPAPLATVSISADNSSITVGQSTTIRASYAAGSGDTLMDTAIDEDGPDTNNTGVIKAFSGPQWGITVQPYVTYVFTPTNPGTYNFYTFVLTNDYPSWTTVPSRVVTVTVSGTAGTPNPLSSMKLRLGPPVIEHGPAYDVGDFSPTFAMVSPTKFYVYGANQVTFGTTTSSLLAYTGEGGGTGVNSVTSLGTGDTIKSNLTATFVPNSIKPIAPALNSDICGDWVTSMNKSNGLWYAFVHNEGPCDYTDTYPNGGYSNTSLSMWTSTSGAPGTWSPMTVPGVSNGTIISSTEVPEKSFLTGFGDGSMIPDDTGKWMYAYVAFYSDNSTSDYHTAIARAPINNLGPGNWKFMYNGSFTAPALNNPYNPATQRPQVDMLNWVGGYVATMPNTPFKVLSADGKGATTYWTKGNQGPEIIAGIPLNISQDYTSFTTMPFPLVNFDAMDWDGHNDVHSASDLYVYGILRNDTDGSSVLNPNHFALWTVYIPPYNSKNNRYTVEYPVTKTTMTSAEIASGEPQEAITLETWYNTQTGKFRTTTINPFASATDGQTESGWTLHDTPGYIMTSCPGSADINQCDAAGAKIANRIEECWQPSSNSNTPWNDDYQLHIDTNGTTGSCPTGWTHVRTSGWLYKAPQAFPINPIYACYEASGNFHFSSISPSCNGQTVLNLLGYAPST